jgi:alkanesulfonate monooxygenase SsuD/methylene tetrahydromethanopterin reductase-like flavin-dependent oxidoreductase (luciferase family)
MFRQPQSTVHGKVARVDGAWNVPQPVQPGGPKILIGGGGERKTLRLTARYADLWNGFGDAATVHHKLEVLREQCAAIGRDAQEIVTTHLGTLIVAETMADAERRKREWQRKRGIPDGSIGARLWWGDAGAIRGQAKSMLDVGLGGLLFNMPAGSSPEDVRLAGEALAPLH